LIGARDLLGHGCGGGGTSDLEVVSTPAEIDQSFVVCIFENSNEHPVAETFAVTAKQLPCMPSHIGRSDRLVVPREIGNRAPNEIECLTASKTLTGETNLALTGSGADLDRMLERRRERNGCGGGRLEGCRHDRLLIQRRS
jgi:hypothetical protein